MTRDVIYRKLIHSTQWAMLRRYMLTENPLCERCLAEGRVQSATEVHHIQPVEEGVTEREKRQLMFDTRNLRALCHNCHVKTHTELGRSGREARIKRNKENVRRIIERFF